MRLLSAPQPEYVQRCRSCGSAFFYFGEAPSVSHNDQYNADVSYQRYLEAANEPSLNHRYQQAINRLRSMLSGIQTPKLFDVGAGGGDFLAMARNGGFQVTGNEVSQPAIDETRARHGIELLYGDDLRILEGATHDYDAVTMWCVIAHVDSPDELLSGVQSLLKPGGILFFSTPRYCAIDTVAFALRRLTRDRYRRPFDRRINQYHRRQYSRKGIQVLLRRSGFAPVSVRASIGYGLHMEEYLVSIGLPQSFATPIGKALEFAACIGLLPRNILTVYARMN